MSFKFTTIASPASLASVVKNFFTIEFDKDITCIDHLLPDGLPSFFYIQSRVPDITYFRNGRQTFFLHDGFHVGYCNTAMEFVHKRLIIVGVSIFPVYFNTLFGKSPAEILNKFIPLEEPDTLKLVKVLIASPENSFARIIELFETYLTDKLNKRHFNNNFLPVFAKLASQGGYHIRVEELAKQLGYSPRYLGSSFKQSFGMSPKKYIKLVRFNQALKHIYTLKEENMNLSSIAHAVGYHDQSHFIRDFKSICGKTPKEILDNSDSLANKFCLF